MGVHKGEDGVVQSKLHHHATFPAPAYHVLHILVLLRVSHETAIISFDEDHKEDLTFTNEFNHIVVSS